VTELLPPPADELREEVARLREQLAEREQAMDEKERQLERYAADLRETYKLEREHALELRGSYMATVRALSNAVEARDAYTGKHAERVAAYGLELSRATGSSLAVDPQIEFGFLLHDIGKVAVPDAILFKPHPLSAHERDLMQRHPVIGWEILREIEFLGVAKHVVRSHHERWDGTGYPDRLAGDAIPYAARVFAVADTLDALTTTRPYRSALPWDEARAIIRDGSGTQFDPSVVEAFNEIGDTDLARIRETIT
jgi:ribonuclease P protein subunit RPR2